MEFIYPITFFYKLGLNIKNFESNTIIYIE